MGPQPESPTPRALRRLDAELVDRLAKLDIRTNEYGYDRYGFHREWARRLFLWPALLYRYWFRVETHDLARVPRGPVLLVGNHAGQVGYDGLMLALAMLLEAEPSRLARGMSEYLFWRLPWVSRIAARSGMVVGTPENCAAMLADGECVVAFPEGARGANKPFRRRYQLERFGQGFARLALQSGAPVVPVGIVGSEEQQPGFANLEDLGHRLGLPSLPITISQPWFGLLGATFALPVKYRIYFGEPLQLEGEPHEEDARVEEQVERVRAQLRALLERGLRERPGIFR
jgi:1-acyl-sn-glycerol-3-phosphate acyltransferase